jgi:hypothetical protein
VPVAVDFQLFFLSPLICSERVLFRLYCLQLAIANNDGQRIRTLLNMPRFHPASSFHKYSCIWTLPEGQRKTSSNAFSPRTFNYEGAFVRCQKLKNYTENSASLLQKSGVICETSLVHHRSLFLSQ